MPQPSMIARLYYMVDEYDAMEEMRSLLTDEGLPCAGGPWVTGELFKLGRYTHRRKASKKLTSPSDCKRTVPATAVSDSPD